MRICRNAANHLCANVSAKWSLNIARAAIRGEGIKADDTIPRLLVMRCRKVDNLSENEQAFFPFFCPLSFSILEK